MTLKKTKAWKYLSLYIRQKELRCFTCGKAGDYREADAGHFFHRSSIMFFDPVFVRRQCTGCNRFKHGNLGIYAINLIGEIGLEAFKEAEKKSHQLKRWSKKELKEIELKYKPMSEVQLEEEKPKKEKGQCEHKIKPPYCAVCHYKKKKHGGGNQNQK